MKILSLQENLKRGLNIVGHGTSKNINLPILNNILIRAKNGNIELVGTNLEIGITHQVRGKIETEGEFTVDSKLISEYVNLLSQGQTIEMEDKDNELSVKCGNYKTKIRGEAASEFPLIPTISEDLGFSCEAKVFKRALESVAFAVSNNDNRLELTGVQMSFEGGKLSLAATDSYRLAERIISVEMSGIDDGQKIIVPSKTVQEVLRTLSNIEESEPGEAQTISVYFSENQILFKIDSVELISRLINGHYPDYKQIMPGKGKTAVSAEKSELVRAVKAAALFSKTGINDITLTFVKGKITVSAFSGASGESQIDLPSEIEGDDNEVTINFRYLLDGLNNIDSDQVRLEIINNSAPCSLKPEKDEGYVYIVMPIRQ